MSKLVKKICIPTAIIILLAIVPLLLHSKATQNCEVKEKQKTIIIYVPGWKNKGVSQISVMTSKSKDWEYEKEWRLISKLPALNNNLYLIPFNSTIILSVFLGLNISEEDRKDITDLLKMIPEVRNISFFQMTSSHDKFELTANKIELA